MKNWIKKGMEESWEKILVKTFLKWKRLFILALDIIFFVEISNILELDGSPT